MSLLNLFKKTGKEEPDKMSNTELYCQNPQCRNPLISEEDYVANVNGNLVHDNDDCVQMYLCHEAMRTRNIVVCPNVGYMDYHEAEKLASKGKVKFSKLETGVKK